MQDTFSHGGNIFYYARRLGIRPEEMIDFSANINPLGPCPAAVQAMQQSVACIAAYPEPEGMSVLAVLSERYGLPVSELILGNGAAEIFYLLTRAIQPARVVITAPVFSEYARAAAAAGACVVEVPASPDEDFLFPLEDFLEAIPQNGLVFLGHPNNPDGRLLPRDAGLAVLQEAKKRGTWVVLDESFIDFLGQGNAYTYKGYMQEYGNLIIVHSLTKFYAVPGLRLGFAAARQDIIERMRQMKDVWNVNMPAQIYGLTALQDEAYQRAAVHIVALQKKILYNALCQISGIYAYEPSVNFMLCRLEKGVDMTVSELQERLLPYRIMIRACRNYTGLDDSFFRVAVKGTQQNRVLIHALQEVLK